MVQAMKQNGAYALVFLGLVCLDAVGASQVLHKRIEPELEPVSDKKFFKKDYPDDARPPQYHKFSHPYPTVQDSDRYDKDYIKDENDDGGYWKAQMAYDSLKNKLAKEKAEMERALAKEAEEKKEFDKAKAAEAAAEKDAEAAEKTEDEAAAARKKADAEHDQQKSALDAGAEDVEQEVKDLADCEQQLADAKARLKKLLAEKENFEKKNADAGKLEAEAEEKEKAAEKSAAELLKEYEKEQKEHEAAKSDVEKEKQDVKKAEDALAKAAERLRVFRKADPDGGVYEVKGSQGGASYASPLAALALVAIGSIL